MIRKYKVISGEKYMCVEAETPQKAIEKVYSNFDIQIEIASKETATHKVELVDAKRNSRNYYKIQIKQLNRKVKPDSYMEPMPKKLLQRLIKDFKAKGGIVVMNEDTDIYLKKQHSEGSALNADTILLVKNPSRSAVYEELIHAEQYRQGKNDGGKEKVLLCEIEAKEILIANKQKWGITDKEDKITRLSLEKYKKDYDEFIKNKR